MRLKNKKGFLLADETVKILIALICIGFLIYFLSALYFSKDASRKKIEAEETLGRIGDIITALPSGSSEIQSISAPKGWHLYSFVSGEKPNTCLGDNCLCICRNVLDIQNTFHRKIKECDDKGACLRVSTLRSGDLDLKILGGDSLVFVEISKSNQGISMREVR
jgi:hypothetical protein